MPDAIKCRSVSNESCFGMQVSAFPWTTKGNLNQALVCIWGFECVSHCPRVSVHVCKSVSRAAERTFTTAHASNDTTASSWSTLKWEDPLRWTSPPFLTLRLGISLTYHGARVGACTSPLEPCQLYLLVGGEAHSTVVALMLTRCCQNEGRPTDIPVNKAAYTHKPEFTQIHKGRTITNMLLKQWHGKNRRMHACIMHISTHFY